MKFIDLNELERDRNFWYSAVGLTTFSGLMLIALGNFNQGLVLVGLALILFGIAYEK